jgi:hypothetical protein
MSLDDTIQELPAEKEKLEACHRLPGGTAGNNPLHPIGSPAPGVDANPWVCGYRPGRGAGSPKGKCARLQAKSAATGSAY